MEASKLIFHLQEIPEGKSVKTVSITSDDLVLDATAELLNADIEIEFYKTDHFIRIQFNVSANTGLVCDRSLDPFTYKVHGSYSILFEPNPVEDSEDEKEAVRQIPSDHLMLSLEKEVRDTILLELPVQKIHPKLLDSEGTPIEFQTQTYGRDPDEDDTVDPRWAALKKLK